jgi:DNA-binding response OmpR family regulator
VTEAAPRRADGPAPRVLIIDDDADLCGRVHRFLGEHQIAVEEALDGEHGLEALARGRFDAVLLDLLLPGLNGIEVVKRIRAHSNVAVLMLTSADTEAERVRALDLGADDYITKPFRTRELLARLRAVLRRSSPGAVGQILTAGDITVDTAGRTATLAQSPLALSAIELDLLVAFMRARGSVLTREALLAEAGRNHVTVTERTVDVHVSRLRKKLGDDPRSPRVIKTVHGIGYVLAV